MGLDHQSNNEGLARLGLQEGVFDGIVDSAFAKGSAQESEGSLFGIDKQGVEEAMAANEEPGTKKAEVTEESGNRKTRRKVFDVVTQRSTMFPAVLRWCNASEDKARSVSSLSKDTVEFVQCDSMAGDFDEALKALGFRMLCLKSLMPSDTYDRQAQVDESTANASQHALRVFLQSTNWTNRSEKDGSLENWETHAKPLLQLKYQIGKFTIASDDDIKAE